MPQCQCVHCVLQYGPSGREVSTSAWYRHGNSKRRRKIASTKRVLAAVDSNSRYDDGEPHTGTTRRRCILAESQNPIDGLASGHPYFEVAQSDSNADIGGTLDSWHTPPPPSFLHSSSDGGIVASCDDVDIASIPNATDTNIEISDVDRIGVPEGDCTIPITDDVDNGLCAPDLFCLEDQTSNNTIGDACDEVLTDPTLPIPHVGPNEIEDPTTMPSCLPIIEDVNVALAFVKLLREASLESDIEPLDPEFIHAIRNPPTHPLDVSEDERMWIELFLTLTHASEKAYNETARIIGRRFPSTPPMPHYEVKNLVEKLSGVGALMRDMCVNSCIGYTGPYALWTSCPHCHEPRYETDKQEKTPRKQFSTLPLAPQLQALFRCQQSAKEMEYRRLYTECVLKDLERNGGIKTTPYRDYFDGTEYIAAANPSSGTIKGDDVVLMMSIDGAQLYQYKLSDCWIYIWVILDRPPDLRYKIRHVLPGGFIPGPHKPKNIDSFIFPGLYHLAALQTEGLKIWNALHNRVSLSHPYLALVTADGPAMASLNGCVGHHGRCHCRYHCPLVGRHKRGGSHYYPVRSKPDNYDVEGCDHDDVDLESLLKDFTPAAGIAAYFQDLERILNATGKNNYEKIRLETGICKPTIFLGLHPHHTASIPGLFSGDSMHLASLNLPDTLISAWRGLLACDKTDNKSLWKWAVLANGEVWKQHGKAVADCTSYIPGSFDRPPRNPADKINSGYKAWEFLLYIFGLGPALFFRLLPDEYWTNYCKLVRAVRILLQIEINAADLREAYDLIVDFSNEYENLYVQRRADRLQFVRACIHTIAHLPAEVVRIGPSAISSQWTMERLIGSLVSEIKLHSDPYANLARRGLRRCQVNALKAMIPDLEDTKQPPPQGSEDVGDGYLLLVRSQRKAVAITDEEARALAKYLAIEQPAVDPSPYYRVKRWARLRLPNGQIARSRWKEEAMSLRHIRTARNVKIATPSGCQYAEVHYFMHIKVNGCTRALAMTSFYGAPDSNLYRTSSRTYIALQHFRDVDIRVVDVKSIDSVVMIAPDLQYRLSLPEDVRNTVKDRYFVMEKPGLKICSLMGEMEDDLI